MDNKIELDLGMLFENFETNLFQIDFVSINNYFKKINFNLLKHDFIEFFKI